FGSLLAAFGSWLLARHAGGEWWVRMEDLDPPREVAGAADRQLATLAAFGLRSDSPVEWQSRRSEFYQAAIDRLMADGKAFACHCSRSELASAGGIHRACVAKGPRSGSRVPAIRLRVPDDTVIGFEDGLQGDVRQDVSREVGDFVLKRADGLWAYQLAVVVDDAAQGMTDIVRGSDLLDSAPRQILLQRALDLSTPRYLHLPLIVDGHGHKLSKSSAALPVNADAPLPSLRAVWQALGQDPAALREGIDVAATLAAASQAFDPTRLPRMASLPLAAAHNATVVNAV
ncbi:MAG TPA: tRNA glutamyl-Q(34) synthetase GluQRS, partial [Pseudoxanthomonas sp.]